jgi:hypothetical protein
LWKRDDNQSVLVLVNIERLSRRRVAEKHHYDREKSATPASRNLVQAIRSSGERFHAVGVFKLRPAPSADAPGVCCSRAKISSCDKVESLRKFAVADLEGQRSRGSMGFILPVNITLAPKPSIFLNPQRSYFVKGEKNLSPRERESSQVRHFDQITRPS